jgi:hypothetical protein
VIPCFLLPILEKGDLLPEGVEYLEGHVRTIGEPVTNGRRGVKGWIPAD